MATPEGKVKSMIKGALKELGEDCWSYWPVSNGMGAHGIPDCVGCYRGVMFGIEVKAPGRRGQKDHGCSPLQVMQLGKIRAAGGVSFVADDKESFLVGMREVLRAGAERRAEGERA